MTTMLTYQVMRISCLHARVSSDLHAPNFWRNWPGKAREARAMKRKRCKAKDEEATLSRHGPRPPQPPPPHSPSGPLEPMHGRQAKHLCSSSEASENRKKKAALGSAEVGVTHAEVDTEGIPPPLSPSDLVELVPNGSRCAVFFDLETTSTSREAQLTQIAARVHNQDQSFSQYLLPTEPTNLFAALYTGINVRTGDSLTVGGTVVESTSQKEGLLRFIQWLKGLGKPVVLVAHSCFNFDMRVLVNAVMREGLMDEFSECVDGFNDSLPLLKSSFPKQRRYGLEDLYQAVFNETFDVHNATADVAALDRLMTKAGADAHSKAVTASSVYTFVPQALAKAKRLDTFSPLIKAKVLSKEMATKAAASGLVYRHLSIAHHLNRENGIETLFKEPTSRGVRVTANSRIVSAVTAFFNKG